MMLTEVMAAEVAELCGPKYHPSEDAACHRAGSASGYVVWEGNRQDVKRPRTRRGKDVGSTEEVRLRTYESARQLDQLHTMVLRALSAGVSGREMGEVHPESPEVSKSSVSRVWIQAGGKLIDELRSREIGSRDWLVLMLDGIVLSKDQTAIVAIGVASDGTKHVLDFELGGTENYEVCRDLVSPCGQNTQPNCKCQPARSLRTCLAGLFRPVDSARTFLPVAVRSARLACVQAAGSYSAIPQSNVIGPEGGQMLVDKTVVIIDGLWK